MATTWLKRGKPDSERAAEDARIRTTVESVLADIEVRGDATCAPCRSNTTATILLACPEHSYQG